MKPLRVGGTQVHLRILNRGGAGPWLAAECGRRPLLSVLVVDLNCPTVGPAFGGAFDPQLDGEPLAALDGRRLVPYDDTRAVRLQGDG